MLPMLEVIPIRTVKTLKEGRRIWEEMNSEELSGATVLVVRLDGCFALVALYRNHVQVARSLFRVIYPAGLCAQSVPSLLILHNTTTTHEPLGRGRPPQDLSFGSHAMRGPYLH